MTAIAIEADERECSNCGEWIEDFYWRPGAGYVCAGGCEADKPRARLTPLASASVPAWPSNAHAAAVVRLREADRSARVREAVGESVVACGCGEHWSGPDFGEAVKGHKCGEADGLRARRARRGAEELARERERREGWREARFLARALGFVEAVDHRGRRVKREGPREAMAAVPPMEAVPLAVLGEARERRAARAVREAAAA